jgi:glucan phosphoethanolaminetransferase (alkaline phosphatase superfamily)
MLSLSTILITIASIGLSVAVFPEMRKIYKSPKKVLAFSPSFLILQLISSFILLTGLMLTKDKAFIPIIVINIWYSMYYSYLVKTYYQMRNKND